MADRQSKFLSLPMYVNQKDYGEPVYSTGCALCSGLMASAFYGTNANNNVQYFLNNYWSSTGGYLWGAPCATFTEATFSLATIKAQIDANHPVIIRASGNGTTHWVIAYGYYNYAKNVSDIQVVDPYQGAVRSLSDAMAITCKNYTIDRMKTTAAK